MKRTVHIAEQVAAFGSRLAPEPRRAVKKALRDLKEELGDIRSLEGSLSGYYRLRIGRYRVVFAYKSDGSIAALFIEERRLVYELFEAQFIKQLKS